MGRRESFEWDDYYSDDPTDSQASTKRPWNIKLFSVILIPVLFSLGFAVAGNIGINSGISSEFGQGISATTSCDNNLVFKAATIWDTATAKQVLDTVTISNIDSVSCNGDYFSIKAYDSSSATPLNLYSVNGTTYNEVDVMVGSNYVPILGGLQSSDVIKVDTYTLGR